MKASVVREMTTQEIKDQLAEERANYVKLKMTNTISPLENPMTLKATRKNVARLMTELVNRNNNGDK